MAAQLYPNWPPDLTDEQQVFLAVSVHDWCLAHGLVTRPSPSLVSLEAGTIPALAATAPVTLFPSPFPRSCFEEGLEIQHAYNALYAAIATDEEWLAGIVGELLDVDEFIAKLWNIHETVKREGYTQDVSLGLWRSDYLVHVDPTTDALKPHLKQVEFNTIASSMGGLANRTSELHRYLSTRLAYSKSALAQPDGTLSAAALPHNPTISLLAKGLADAHALYEQEQPSSSANRGVLMIVQDKEQNIFDQKLLEGELQKSHGIPVFHATLSRVLDDIEVTRDKYRKLIYHPPHALHEPVEISVVYYRAGYSPEHYPSENEWVARLRLEGSAAIKCPSVLAHLAGSKKVQQVLATPSSPHLDRFLADEPSMTEGVRATFTNIYPLDESPAGLEARRLALDPATASRYVLKPQREGGGNNVYRGAIPAFLRSLPETHWKSYILMEIIEPPALRNSILRNGRVQTGGVIGELGVFGVCLWRRRREEVDNASAGEASQTGKTKKMSNIEILRNDQAGYVLRTKGRESEEGGVAAGYGCIDSCLLVDV